MFMGANRMGRLFSGMGSVSRGVINTGKYGMDKALAGRMTMAATMVGGASLYGMTRNSNSRIVRGVGDIGLMAAGGVGAVGAYRGMMGGAAQGIARSSVAGFNRMRRSVGY